MISIKVFSSLSACIIFFSCQLFVVMSMRAAQFLPGGPELLNIGDVPLPLLRDHEIMIKVHATAINRADTLQRKGSYPAPPGESDILGLEAAGVVYQLGSNTTKWRVGDRVMALLPGGGNAEFVAVHEDHVLSVPPTMSFTHAAAIPEVWLTAYQLLFTVGRLVDGETVLVHAAGSGVGTAAIQLAKQAGAVVLATAGSDEKLMMAKSLGADEGFNYKQVDFSEEVLKHTNNRGVDVVLDCVGASYWEKNTKSLRVDGRWVLYGSMGGVHVDGNILGVILRKRINLVASTLRTRSTEYKAQLVADFSKNSLQHFVDGRFKPIIDMVLPLSEIADAHKRMESNVNTGKIILEVIEEHKHADL